METKECKLTKKQGKFVLEYQKDFNATQAAIRAGFSPKTASEMGYKLVHKSLVVKEVLERDINERLQRLGDRADATLEELLRVAHFDVRKLFNKDGSMKSPDEWDDATAAAVSGLQVFEEFAGRGEQRIQIGLTKKVKAFDKIKALELLGRHQKIFPEGNEGNKVAVIVLQPGEVRMPANSGVSEEGD